jgi:DNA-binding NtrC family response regulator
LVGPTGVGKEVCARAIHRLGRRSSGPFVAVNCASIPDNLAESELFGHLAGAFTNARERRLGAFERANGGTLFLDELEAFPVHLQPKILRAIQDREVTPIGGQRPIRCDFALASATNEDPEALVKDGRLRKDLYARLRGFVIEVPTLRARRSDILRIAASVLGTKHPLCSHFLARAMLNCDWPLNVRELIEFAKSVAPLGKNSPASVRKNIVEKFIDDHFPESKDSQGEPARDQIVAALRKHAGKVMPAAKDLACERTKFYRLLEQHGVRPADYRG